MSRPSFEFDRVNLSHLAVQTAASILVAVEQRSADGADSTSDPISRKVAVYYGYANRVYLDSQVRFLYQIVEWAVDRTYQEHFLGLWQRQMITDALSAYQAWKTFYSAAEKLRNKAPNWGNATEFVKTDWTKLNERLLAQSDFQPIPEPTEAEEAADLAYDPYYQVSDEQKAWLVSLFEGTAPTPNDVAVARIRGGFDLEYHIDLTEAAGEIYTEEVCKDLRAQVAAKLGHPAPILRFYIDDTPTPWTAAEQEENDRYRAASL